MQACWQIHRVSQHAEYFLCMTKALHDQSGQADLALLNQTLSDFAVTAQQELACIALQQLHGILYCHELGAERFPTIDKEGCILACMHRPYIYLRD